MKFYFMVLSLAVLLYFLYLGVNLIRKVWEITPEEGEKMLREIKRRGRFW